MELNKKGQNELINYIENNVPNGLKIKLPKNELERLIFYSVKTDEYNAKYPIRTGKFLQKIDLSELSFENVEWDKQIFIDMLNSLEIQHNLTYDNDPIDFSHTNANINLALRTNKLKYTNMVNCNFEGLDLSNLTLYLTNFVEGEGLVVSTGNNFKNTRLRIVTNNEVVNQEILGSDEELIKEAQQRINEEILKGTFDGCYIDDYLIENGKVTEKKAPPRKQELQDQYELYQQNIINSIDEQVKKNR